MSAILQFASSHNNNTGGIVCNVQLFLDWPRRCNLMPLNLGLFQRLHDPKGDNLVVPYRRCSRCILKEDQGMVYQKFCFIFVHVTQHRHTCYIFFSTRIEY